MTTVVPTEEWGQLSTDDAVRMGAESLKAYGRIFFPRTYRQDSPAFHDTIGQSLYGPERHVAFKVFRGGAKTTLLRVFTSQRVAYAVSRTIMFVSETQDHSIRSIRWLKRQVQYNKLWAQTFGLEKGSVWTNEVISVYNRIEDVEITILAVGITGQIRGVNIDDYRPDLIIVDDPNNEENTKTPEQRAKMSGLFFGALERSLAPAIDSANAKMVLLQTPLHAEDLIHQCEKDGTWRVITYSCFDENGASRWESRFPLETLLLDKQAYVARNQLVIWMREMECRIIASSKTAFDPKWLGYWDVLPDNMIFVIAIDPASSDADTADSQAICVLGKVPGKKRIWLMDYSLHQGEMPDLAANYVLQCMSLYQPRAIACESIGYQRILAWYLAEAMKKERKYCQVYPVQDKRSKADRIIQSFVATGLAPYGDFLIKKTHLEFITQFTEYGPDVDMHEDLLDAVAMGIRLFSEIDGNGDDNGETIDGEYERVDDEDEFVDRYGLPKPRGSGTRILSGCP